VSVIIGDEADVLFFPYNSEIDSEGNRDRLYDSQDWADYFRQFIGNGVYPNPATGLRVDSLHSSRVLTVRMGAAFLQGRFYLQKRNFEFSVDSAHLTLGRRDIVVCRHNIITRTSMIHYIAGTPASNPQVPAIVRTNDIFDLQLCTITVNPNAQAITQANILDTRSNNTVCGFVTGVVQQVDTTSLFNQYQVFLNEQIAFWNQARNAWAAEQGTWKEDMSNLIKAMETQSFDLINNNFDDWSVRRGCDKTTVFNANGSITETIRVVAANFILAVKNTVFNGDGSITETITFNPWEMAEGYITALTTAFTITKRTIFNADGSIREEIR